MTHGFGNGIFPQFYSRTITESDDKLMFAYNLPDGAMFQCLAPNLQAPAAVYIDGVLVGRAVTVGNARIWFDHLKDCMDRGLCTTWVDWKEQYLHPESHGTGRTDAVADIHGPNDGDHDPHDRIPLGETDDPNFIPYSQSKDGAINMAVNLAGQYGKLFYVWRDGHLFYVRANDTPPAFQHTDHELIGSYDGQGRDSVDRGEAGATPRTE